MALKSVRRTPYYVYFLAFLLAFPARWLLDATWGDNVPGMIGMVEMIVLFGVFSIGIETVRRRFVQKHER
ncbi:MAG TPA: hypothetical protein VEP30_02560 [Chthoniobacterales bacterium]|nr:hypothetical protein [Chthoniobacterales bacterium]